jgi:hexulose-6-phosphate isomerase
MPIDRRRFLTLAAAAGAGSACTGLACAGRARADGFTTTIRKARIGMPRDEAGWKKIRDEGFDGVETPGRGATPDAAARSREAAEKAGLRIHSVLGGWQALNAKDPAAVQRSLDGIARTLRAAQGYGADAILLVPCKIGGMPMPEPWEFKIAFDGETGHLTRVVEGDNAPFKAYMEAQDHATDATREAVKKLIPVAEETRVVIALENVWNNLWVRPAFFRWLVASFESPWVRAYYDIGNHVKYAPPEAWIEALGPLIAKLHAKDFALKPDGRGGRFVPLRQGSVNWPSVRRALDAAGFNGWMTIEGRGTAGDLDRIIKGE